jgi:hypothetical protein
MNYSELNKTQVRCIDAYIKLRPELASQPTITRPEVEALHAQLFAERANGGAKIGYPMWLVKNDKLGRGIYEFPAPELDSAPILQKTPVAKAKTSKTVEEKAEAQAKVEQEDKEFFTDLKEYGIMETA